MEIARAIQTNASRNGGTTDATSTLAMVKNREMQIPIFNRHITIQQVSAIRFEAALGNQIKGEYPQFAEEYRSGLTAPKLVEKYAIDKRYGVNARTGIAAVRYAIRGYDGYFHDFYNGLIPTASERTNLASAHNRQTGIEASLQKKGIHALTREQRADCGRKGGLISGPLSYWLRIGCHALSPEILREHCRKIAPLGGKAGGRLSALAQGMVLYVPATLTRCSEMEFAFLLATNPLYLGPVRANFKKIAEKVNEVFEDCSPLYTRTTLKIALQRYRRQARSAGHVGTDPEVLFAAKLASHPAYQLAPRLKAEQIAGKVNDEYHEGRLVRNAMSIRAAIRRHRSAI